MTQHTHTPFKPSLSTKSETEWLLGKTHLSKTHEYKIKSRLKALSLKYLYFKKWPVSRNGKPCYTYKP
jgi:hypothetical protein